jgi:hypothetical protein
MQEIQMIDSYNPGFTYHPDPMKNLQESVTRLMGDKDRLKDILKDKDGKIKYMETEIVDFECQLRRLEKDNGDKNRDLKHHKDIVEMLNEYVQTTWWYRLNNIELADVVRTSLIAVQATIFVLQLTAFGIFIKKNL